MKYQLSIYGHPVLRQPASPVRVVDRAIRVLAEEMLEIMVAKNGVGLAAQQIGRTEQICTLGFDPQYDVAAPGGPRLNPGIALPLTMINPSILMRTGSQTDTEGCLSIPEIWAPVSRAWEVSVSFINLQGVPQVLRVRGFLARIIQHELDHLHGILFVDRLAPVKKISLARQLKRLRKTSMATLSAS